MPAPGRGDRAAYSRRSGAHDHDLLFSGCHGEVQFRLSGNIGVHGADQGFAEPELFITDIAADAGGDVFRLSRMRLRRPIGIGDDAAAHGYHVAVTVGEKLLGLVRDGDAAGAHDHGIGAGLLDLTGQRQEGVASDVHVRHAGIPALDEQRRGCGAHMQIDRLRLRQTFGDANAQLFVDAAGQFLIGAELHAHRETGILLFDAFDDIDRKLHASFETAAVLVRAPVGRWRHH